MENQTFSEGNIQKSSVISYIKMWLAADPLLHIPLALSLSTLFNIILAIGFISAFGWLKSSLLYHYGLLTYFAIMILITGYITIELFLELKHHLRVKRMKRKTELDNLIHYYHNRPDEHKTSEARHLFTLKHRLIDIFSGRGGVSPIEIITPDPPIVESISESPIVERKVELFKGGEDEKNFYFTILGVDGKVSFKQISDWKSAAYIKFQKDPKQQEAYRIRKAEFDKCLQLRNEEYVRRVVNKFNIDVNNTDLAVYFREQPTEQGSKPYRVVGKRDSVLKYINQHQIQRELNQVPDPKQYHVKVTEHIWKDNIQMNMTGYGCIFQVNPVKYEKG
jgi:hypothetical protein